MNDNNPYDEILARQDNTSLRVSLNQAVDYNPDTEAKLKKLAQRYNLPIEAVRLEQPAIERRAKIDSFDYDSLLEKSPKTAKLFQDPNAARIAYDDVDGLSNVEGLLTTPFQRDVDFLTKPFTNTAISAATGIFPNFAAGVYGTGEAVSAAAGITPLQQTFGNLRKIAQETGRQWMLPVLDDASETEQAIYSGFQSIGQMAPGLALSLLSGGSAAPALALAGATSGGAAAGEALDLGVPPVTSLLFGLSQGGIEAATEKLPIGRLLGDVLSGKGFGQTLARQVITDMPGEQVATVLQSFNDWAVLNPNKPLDQQETWDDYLAGLPDDMRQTAIATMTAIAGQTGAIYAIGKVSERMQQDLARLKDQQQQRADTLHEAVQSTKTAARAPEILKQHVEAVAPEGKVYLDGQEALTLYQSLPPEEQANLSTLLPDFVKNLQSAAASGGDVILTQAEYISNIASRKELNAFASHYRIAPDELSAAQLANTDVNAEMQSLLDSLDDETSNAVDMQDYEIAQQRIYDQLLNAGKTPDEARQVSTFAGQAYQALSKAAEGGEASAAIRRVLDGITIEPMARQELRKRGDALDLQLDEARTFFKQQAKKEQRKGIVSKAVDMFGMSKPSREKAAPTPLLSWVESQGGFKRTDALAGDIKQALDKKAARAFRKDGKLALDTIPVSEWNSAFQDRPALQYNEPGADYVDSGFILEKLKDEEAGNFARNPQQELEEQRVQNFDYLNNQVQQALGKDILSASNEEIRKAITPGQGQVLNQSALPEKITLDGKERWTVNSKGAPIARTEEGIRNFWNWFGDSKVVDGEGRPLVVYHGTAANIENFTSSPSARGLLFVTKDPSFASNYAESRGDVIGGANVLPLYVSAKKLHKKMRWSDAHGYGAKYFIDRAYDGVRIIDDGKVETLAVVSPTQIKSATGNSGAFDPANPSILEQDARGQVQFSGDESIITLFEKSDKSTVLHELSHVYVRAMREAVAAGDAGQQFVKDWESLKAFAGATDNALTVPQEEKIASAFEQYLYEGRAPSVELAGVFHRIKIWMTRIYKGLKRAALDAGLNDTVRGVFDRMLATNEQMEQMVNKINFAVDPALLNLMNPQEQVDHIAKVERSHQTAEAIALKKALAQWERQYSDEYKAARAKIEAEQKDILYASNPARVFHFLTTGGTLNPDNPSPLAAGKLDRAWIEQNYSKEYIKYLPKGSVAKGAGLQPSLVADAFGFESAEQMLETLRDFPGLKQKLKDMTDAEMMRRYGDMLKDGSLEREVQEALATNVDRTEQLISEMRAISRRLTLSRVVIPASQLKAAAKKIIADTPINKMIPYQYYVSELRAFHKVGKALGAGDFDTAMREKERQLLNHFLYREALAKERSIDKALAGFKKLNKPDKFFGRNDYDIDYVNAARAVLAKFGLGKSKFDVAAWLQQLKNEPDIEQRLGAFIDGFNAAAKPYKQLTISEFESLKDSIDNVMYLAKEERQAQQDMEGATIKEASEAVLEAFAELPNRQALARVPGLLDVLKVQYLGYAATVRRVEAYADAFDNGNPDGVLNRFVVRPIQRSVDRYFTNRQEAFTRLVEILSPMKERLNEIIDVRATELQREGQPFHFKTRSELLGLVQHLGNESNRDKLLRGYNWSEEGLNTFLLRMQQRGILTKQDFDLVQEIWGFYESIKPVAWAAHKAMHGYRPPEIIAAPFRTIYGDYKGGYVPAITDKLQSAQGAEMAAKMMFDEFGERGSFMFPTPANGFTKARAAGFAAPLAFDLSLVVNHVDTVMKYAYIAPTVRAVARSLGKDVRNVMEAAQPGVYTSMIAPWLQRTVRQQRNAPSSNQVIRGFDWLAQKLGSRLTAQYLMLNASSALQNVTNLFPAGTKVGARPLAESLGRVLSDRAGTTQFINERSVMMSRRSMLNANNMRTAAEDILNPPSAFQAGERWTLNYGWFGFNGIQFFTEKVTWIAQYNNSIADGRTEKQAAEDADSAVRLTQGSNEPQDISEWEAISSIGKAFFPFQGYFIGLSNYAVTELQKAKQLPEAMQRSARLATLYGGIILMPSILANLIVTALADRWPEDEEKDGAVWDDWVIDMFVMPQIKLMAAMVPVFGLTVLNPIIGQFTSVPFDDRYSTPLMQLGENVARSVDRSYGALTADGDQSKALESALFTAGMITGLPLYQGLGNPLGYGVNLAEGDERIEAPLDPVRGILGGASSK